MEVLVLSGQAVQSVSSTLFEVCLEIVFYYLYVRKQDVRNDTVKFPFHHVGEAAGLKKPEGSTVIQDILVYFWV